MKSLLWSCGLLGAVIWNCGCAGPDDGPVLAAPAQPELAVVSVTSPVERTLARQVQLTGEFRPWQQADLHAKIAGYLKSLRVDTGSVVQAGELIGTLQVPELESELIEGQAAVQRGISEESRARAQMERAKAQVGVAKAAYERLGAVNRKEPGLVAGQELDETIARLRGAEADIAAASAMQDSARQQVDAARARLQRVQTMMEYCKITAPFAGVVTKRFADPGNMIQAGVASQTQALPLVRIADIHRLRLALVIPENLAPEIKVGTELEIQVPALGRSLQGRIARLNQQVATNSRAMEAEVDVLNPKREIIPGMVADVFVKAETRASVLSLPIQAVARRGGSSYVLAVNESGIVEERKVETGSEGAAHVEIRSGAAASDRIVVGNRTMLRPGQKVRPKTGAAG